MAIFHEAVRLNNQGVDALANGDGASAIMFLSAAIEVTKRALSEAKASSSSSNEEGDTRIGSTLTVEISSGLAVASREDGSIFSRAIKISSEAPARSTFSDMKIYSSAMIFNLALVHHVSSHRDARSLVKAEKLYCMLLKLLDKSALNVHTGVVLKLACIHNLSWIRHMRGETTNKHAGDGLGEVVSFIMRQRPMFKDDPDIQSLLVCTLLLMKVSTLAPAA